MLVDSVTANNNNKNNFTFSSLCNWNIAFRINSYHLKTSSESDDKYLLNILLVIAESCTAFQSVTLLMPALYFYYSLSRDGLELCGSSPASPPTASPALPCSAAAPPPALPSPSDCCHTVPATPAAPSSDPHTGGHRGQKNQKNNVYQICATF